MLNPMAQVVLIIMAERLDILMQKVNIIFGLDLQKREYSQMMMASLFIMKSSLEKISECILKASPLIDSMKAKNINMFTLLILRGEKM